MKTEFLRPRFTGARFEDHTLPVEVARDLAAYEELIIELAKHLWLTEHPGRERVQRGFERGFSLHLEGMIGAGSAKPLLSWVVAGAVTLNAGAPSYYERARDLVEECVRASSEQRALPDQFPKELLAYFNVFGRSLRDGEALELTSSESRAPAILDPVRRRALVLAGQREYTMEVELAGTIEETDWGKKSFRLRLKDGGAITVPLLENHQEHVRAEGGKERTVVVVKGLGVCDSWDNLLRVTEVQHLDVMPNAALADELDELAELKDGWFEGSGRALDKAQLDWVTDRLLKTFPSDLAFPLVAPTTDGELFLEWVVSPWRVSAEIQLVPRKVALQATNTSTGHTFDQDLSLDDQGGWSGFYDFVRQYIRAS